MKIFAFETLSASQGYMQKSFPNFSTWGLKIQAHWPEVTSARAMMPFKFETNVVYACLRDVRPSKKYTNESCIIPAITFTDLGEGIPVDVATVKELATTMQLATAEATARSPPELGGIALEEASSNVSTDFGVCSIGALCWERCDALSHWLPSAGPYSSLSLGWRVECPSLSCGWRKGLPSLSRVAWRIPKSLLKTVDSQVPPNSPLVLLIFV